MKRIVTILLFAAALTSCTSTKTVYRIGNGWAAGPTKSAMTGISYSK